MTALTAVYDGKRRDGQLVLYPLAAGAKVYKGALVQVNTATGLAQPAGDNAGAVFAGVAYETGDNTVYAGIAGSGAAGAVSVRVAKTGAFVYSKAGAAQADVGKACLAVDDNTVATAATTNNLGVGYVAQWVDGAHVLVRIDRGAQ